MNDKALLSEKGAVFIQFTPGKKPSYLGCVDLDAISEPHGDQTLIFCRDEYGQLKTVAAPRGAPGAVTTSITQLVFPEPSLLDDLKDCPLQIYAQTYDCTRADEFGKAVRGTLIHDAIITNVTEENIVKRADSAERTFKLDLSGQFPAHRYRRVKAGIVGGGPDAVLTDIMMLPGRCASSCGEYKADCTDGVVIGYPVGSATTPHVWITHDGGVTWTQTAAEPFAAGAAAEQVAALKSVVIVPISKGVNRIIVARGTAAGVKPAVSYSDDDGATWHIVSLTAGVVAKCAVGPESLYALDAYHIWFVDDAGYIYYSDDAAVTWDLFDAGVASGAAALNAVHFADASNGFSVGPAGLVIASTDGGVSWEAMTATGAGALNSVHTFDAQRVIVGGATVGLWMSYDGGVSWNVLGVPGGSGTIDDIHFLNDFVGYLVVGTDLARSVDGGYTWELYASPGAFDAAAVWGCSPNSAFFVGATAGTSPSIIKLN